MKKLVSVMAALVLFLCLLPLSAAMEDVDGTGTESAEFLDPIELLCFNDTTSSIPSTSSGEGWSWDGSLDSVTMQGKNILTLEDGCNLNFKTAGFSIPDGTTIIVNGDCTITTGLEVPDEWADTTSSPIAAFWVRGHIFDDSAVTIQKGSENASLTLSCTSLKKPIEDPNSSSNSVQRLGLIHFSDCVPYDKPSEIGLTIDGVSVNLDMEEVPCGIMTGDLTVTGGGSLDIDMGFKSWNGDDDKLPSVNVYGIFAKNLTVNGTDKTLKQLDISISSDTKRDMYLDGMFLGKNLTLTNCSAAINIVDNVTNRDNSGAIGISRPYSSVNPTGQVAITNCKVDIDVKGNRASGISAQSTGISVTNSEMNITATSTNGSTGIQTSSEDIIIDSSTVNVESIQTENQDGQIVGILNFSSSSAPTGGNVIIHNKSTVTIEGQTTSLNPSLFCLQGQNVTVTGNSTVNITGTATADTTDTSKQDRVDSYGISAADTFTAKDSTVNVDLTTTISPNVTYSRIVKSWGINGGKSVSIDNSAVNVISKGNLTAGSLPGNAPFVFTGISSLEEGYDEEKKEIIEIPGTISISGDKEVKADVILSDAALKGEAFMPAATLVPDENGNTLVVEKNSEGSVIVRPARKDAGVTSVSVNGVSGVVSGNSVLVTLPEGSAYPTDSSALVIVPSDENAAVSTPVSPDGGFTWTFTVTAEDGKTTVDYVVTIMMASSYYPPEPQETPSGWTDLSSGSVYYKNGVKVKGWQEIDGETYFFDNKGYLQTGWLEQDGAWYYLDAKTGVRQLGWQKSGNTWYYLDPASGKMYAGGEYRIGGETYYFYSWGGMASGWWYLDEETGLWYYFRGNGAMAKNAWIEWKGAYYYVGSTGAMLVNTTTPDGYRVDASGKWIR